MEIMKSTSDEIGELLHGLDASFGVLTLACLAAGTTGSGILLETRIKPHSNVRFFPSSSPSSR